MMYRLQYKHQNSDPYVIEVCYNHSDPYAYRVWSVFGTYADLRSAMQALCYNMGGAGVTIAYGEI